LGDESRPILRHVRAADPLSARWGILIAGATSRMATAASRVKRMVKEVPVSRALAERPLVTIAVLFLWVCFLFALLWTGTLLYSLGQAVCTFQDQPTIVSFVADGNDDKLLAAQFHQRSKMLLEQTPAASWKAPFAQPGMTDLVTLDLGSRTSQELQAPLEEQLKDVQISVGGVDVTGLAKFVAKATFQTTPTITGVLITYSDSMSMTLTLQDSAKAVQKSWTRTAHVPLPANESARKRFVEGLIDALLFDVAVYRRDKDSPGGNSALLDSDELAHLHLGRRHLQSYYRFGDHDDLMQAIDHFRELVRTRPTHIDGRLLLGLTLHENRQADEAIDVFNTVVDDIPLTETILVKQRQRLDALFMRGKARFFTYDWDKTLKAIDDFQTLASSFNSLEVTLSGSNGIHPGVFGTQKAREDHAVYCKMMRLRAKTEWAHCYGHMIRYLARVKEDKVRAIQEELSLSKGGASQKTVGAHQLVRASGQVTAVAHCKMDRPTPRPGAPTGECLQKTFEARQAVAAKFEELAKKLRDEVEAALKSWAEGKDRADLTAHLKDRADLTAHLKEVQGYAEYRRAAWLPPNDEAGYQKRCNESISTLKSAERMRISDYYALLQNLGMIYLDRRFDPQGKLLETAEEYFKKSIAQNLSDYYGYEQLALCAARKAVNVDGEKRRNEITKGTSDSEKALLLRPECKSCKIINLVLRLMELKELRGDSSKHSAQLELLHRDLASAFTSRESAQIKLLDLLYRAESLLDVDPAKFPSEKQEVEKDSQQLSSFVAPLKDLDWKSSEQHNAAEDLITQLKKATDLASLKNILKLPYKLALPTP
jgi:hypothetical protein